MEAPSHFKPAGVVLQAYHSPTEPPFLHRRRYSGSRARGVAYEKRAQKYLQQLFPETYIPSPWLRFQGAEGAWRWCQPDGLIIDLPRGILTCVEVKYQHTSDAWWQVRHLYLPVLRLLYRPDLWELQVCEIVRWYDPATLFPEAVELAFEPSRPSGKFKVHIWRP